MKQTARYTLLAIALVALAASPASAGCGKSCYDIECVRDDPSIGCVENWGYCWEIPCFGAADSEGCSVDQKLTEAFASFEEGLTGAEALERLRSDETFSTEILPFLRVVSEDGEVHRGEEYQRQHDIRLAEENAGQADDTAAAKR